MTMNKCLADFLVVSDLDGTLLQVPDGISDCSRTVIRLFTMMGGRFTVASGRSPLSVKNALKGLPLSAPAIVFNGGMLYDYQKEEPLLEHFVPRQTALSAIQFVMQQEPSVGVEILSSNGRMYLPHCCEYICRHAAHESLPYVAAQLDDIPGDWYKILFAGSPSEIAKLEGLVQQQEWENAYFTATNQNYLELMPAGVDKGSALQELCGRIGTAIEDVFAVGDDYNDLPMLQKCGHPVAVGNAVAQVKLASEIQVLPCRDGGVAQLLYDLIRRYGN